MYIDSHPEEAIKFNDLLDYGLDWYHTYGVPSTVFILVYVIIFLNELYI